MTNTTHTTSHPGSPSTFGPGGPPRRRRGVGLVIAAVALATVAIAGCSDEQRRSLGEEDLRDSLNSLTVAAIDSADASPNGRLSCTADIGSDSAVTATCTGTVEGGGVVEGTFTGTADVDAETCSAQLLVRIDGDTVAERDDTRCFDSV
jgi:hypothetical protein